MTKPPPKPGSEADDPEIDVKIIHRILRADPKPIRLKIEAVKSKGKATEKSRKSAKSE